MNNNFLRWTSSSLLALIVIVCLSGPAAAQDARDRGPRSSGARGLAKPLVDDFRHYTTIGNIGLTVTNFSNFGNGFSNPEQPSCEYPRGSGVEHLYRGGLWVGARTPDGTIHVTTGALDAGSVDQGEGSPEPPSRSPTTPLWASRFIKKAMPGASLSPTPS